MNDFEANKLAESFWNIFPEREAFPRSLEKAVLWRLPIAIVKLPCLGLKNMRSWCSQRNISLNINMPNRFLRACLIARKGCGIIFIENGDSENEYRFGLAHEISHFLLDYYWPRRQAATIFGKTIYDVLDGNRDPTPSEKLNSILKATKIGLFLHLMERSIDGSINNSHIIEVEDRADRLALELLAPKVEVLQRVANNRSLTRDVEFSRNVCNILVDEFGLTYTTAEHYSRVIIQYCKKRRSFSKWIRK